MVCEISAAIQHERVHFCQMIGKAVQRILVKVVDSSVICLVTFSALLDRDGFHLLPPEPMDESSRLNFCNVWSAFLRLLEAAKMLIYNAVIFRLMRHQSITDCSSLSLNSPLVAHRGRDSIEEFSSSVRRPTN